MKESLSQQSHSQNEMLAIITSSPLSSSSQWIRKIKTWPQHYGNIREGNMCSLLIQSLGTGVRVLKGKIKQTYTGREEWVGRRKCMSKGKETPESKRPSETRILVCLQGTMHVGIQWCMTTAERKTQGPISHTREFELHPEERRNFQRVLSLGRAKIFLFLKVLD